MLFLQVIKIYINEDTNVSMVVIFQSIEFRLVITWSNSFLVPLSLGSSKELINFLGEVLVLNTILKQFITLCTLKRNSLLFVH
jgi:hypothetical protein